MTLPRYEAVCAHWERVPPISVSAAAIAASMGVKRQKVGKGAGEQERTANRQGLFDMLGGAGFKSETPEWLRQQATT